MKRAVYKIRDRTHTPIVGQTCHLIADQRAGRGEPWGRFRLLFISLALPSVLLLSQVSAAPLTLIAEPSVIDAGQSCVLTWTSDGENAFLLNHGPVKPNGSLRIQPSHSDSFTIVVQTKGKVEGATVKVEVKGQRGGIQLHGIDEFKFSSPGNETSLDYDKFLGVVEDVLRKNHFQPFGTFLKSESHVAYYTDSPERNDLRGSEERGRNLHRLSYYIEIDQPSADDPKVVKFDVKALVEFKPAAQSDWYPSEDGELAGKCASDLKDQILAASTGKTK